MQNDCEGGKEASHHEQASGNVSHFLTTLQKNKTKEKAHEAQLTNWRTQCLKKGQ